MLPRDIASPLRWRRRALLAAWFDRCRALRIGWRHTRVRHTRSRYNRCRYNRARPVRVHVLPQLDSAEQPLFIAYYFHILGRFEADELAIAAAEVEPVV